jgi:coenzyme F420-reducing hydrogenase beta subunit
MEICNSKNMCTGCGACANICPVNCINMNLDNEGFLRPFVEYEKCIKCEKCKKYCPSNNLEIENFSINEVEAYSFINSNKTILQKSSSGGIFSAIAENIIKQGGTVFGATYDKNYEVTHLGVNNIDNLDCLRGSKYVESNTKNTFLEVKEILEKNQMVLYTGTPCQIAGLYAVLGDKEYKKLYTIDLLCHGVPSITLFREYIQGLEKKYGKILSYTFRDKTKWGWGSWGSFIYVNQKGKKYKKNFVVANDYFYSLFFKECILRESCYKCKYAQLPRIADITIGDCWGIENIDSSADTKNGISLVLVNNQKGKDLLNTSVKKSELKSLKIKEVIKYNKTIVQPASRPKERDEFYIDFINVGFYETAKKYCTLKYVTPIIARYIPKKIKKILKNILRR